MNRETIYTALFAKLSAVTNFKVASRRVRLWTDVSPSDKPSLFMAERQDEYVQQRGLPGKITLNCDVFIYTNVGKDPNVIPATQMNTILDAIDTALAPDNFPDYVQTLGGLVSHCWIEGPIIIDTGDIDGDGIAVIPIKILTNH